jgi:hypothetical protein
MTGLDRIVQMTAQDFRALGLQQVAYLRPVTVDGAPACSVHAADGTVIVVMRDRAAAYAAVRQHDLEPLSVH